MKNSMKTIVRHLGLTEYNETFSAMKMFTNERDEDTADEIWVNEHYPVFTQGQAGKPEHLLNPHNIPVIQSDRGGQITYHAPGQLVMYPLVDIKRVGIGVRQMVDILENSIVATLSDLGIKAYSDPKAPGVYVDAKKIASLGLRVRKGRTYHGLALNVDMDLTPFQFINPCGYQGLQMTQVVDLQPQATMQQVEQLLLNHLISMIENASAKSAE